MTEEQAKEGLNTCGYYGKWKNAIRVASAHPRQNMDYWEQVRLHFLELGGDYIRECPEPDPNAKPLNQPWIPRHNFEYTKVRRA